MFGRKNKYREIVVSARQAAKMGNCDTIVYQQGKKYDWTFGRLYSGTLELSDQPVIRLLVCLPDGTVAQ